MSALNWMRVRELREAYAGGETQGSLSKRFGVSVITIGRIVRGESWQEKGGGGAVTRTARDDSQVDAVWKLVKRTPDVAIRSMLGVLISLP